MAAQALLDLERNVNPLLDKIQDCGIDCLSERALLKERADLARAVKRNFFPDQP
jgi:hypothetical protein